MRTASFVGTVGLISICSLVLLNIAADKSGSHGLKTLRDYTIRRNG